jgi:hypothetical protein
VGHLLQLPALGYCELASMRLSMSRAQGLGEQRLGHLSQMSSKSWAQGLWEQRVGHLSQLPALGDCEMLPRATAMNVLCTNQSCPSGVHSRNTPRRWKSVSSSCDLSRPAARLNVNSQVACSASCNSWGLLFPNDMACFEKQLICGNKKITHCNQVILLDANHIELLGNQQKNQRY